MTAEAEIDVAIVGAGAAGLIAALRAHAAGARVVLFERDAVPSGSTALSAGLIPAARTRFQRAAGIDDSIELFAADILAKADGEPDAEAVKIVTAAVGPALEWLADVHGLPFSVITDFRYPGHSAYRMHGLPSRSGVEFMDRLRATAEAAGIDIICKSRVTGLLSVVETSGVRRVSGVEIMRPDGASEQITATATILACNGYGGNKALVAEHIPDMSGALYFGHPGNTGEALVWGEQVGAAMRHLSGYQGHGSVIHPHGILLTWATITEGGFQTDANGHRFHNEAGGYSEAAARVLAQPDGVVWTIFDSRIAAIARQFEDFRRAEAAGAILAAPDLATLAARTRIPLNALTATFADIAVTQTDSVTDDFGRSWSGIAPLTAPYCAARVTGALFHTQGGLVVDANARVLGSHGRAVPGLFAAGGAACGVSGAQAHGYLSGNGLLTAVAYGYLAGSFVGQNLTKNQSEHQ